MSLRLVDFVVCLWVYCVALLLVVGLDVVCGVLYDTLLCGGLCYV